MRYMSDFYTGPAFAGMLDRFADGFLMDFAAEDPDCRAAGQVAIEMRALGFDEEAIRLARKTACVEAVSRLATFNSALDEVITHDA
jgi:hypothetical protein